MLNHVSLKQILKWAKKNKVALPAFNATSLDFLIFVAEFSCSKNFPIIIQFSKKLVQFYTPEVISSVFTEIRNRFKSNIYLHLDHCDDQKLIINCIDSGFDSVMADFSCLSIEKNIENVNTIISKKSNEDCLIEAEVGSFGVEDDIGSKLKGQTSIEEAKLFLSNSKVDLFAPSFGNAHGFYSQKKPKINLKFLENIRKFSDVNLVLHGATGLTEDQINRTIKLGIVKVNFSTIFKETYNRIMKKYLDQVKLDHFDAHFFNKILKKQLVVNFQNIYILVNKKHIRF